MANLKAKILAELDEVVRMVRESVIEALEDDSDPQNLEGGVIMLSRLEDEDGPAITCAFSWGFIARRVAVACRSVDPEAEAEPEQPTGRPN